MSPKAPRGGSCVRPGWRLLGLGWPDERRHVRLQDQRPQAPVRRLRRRLRRRHRRSRAGRAGGRGRPDRAAADHGFTASWTATPGAASYALWYQSGGHGWTSLTTTQTSSAVTGLVAGAPYQVEVQASNGGGAGPLSAPEQVVLRPGPDSPVVDAGSGERLRHRHAGVGHGRGRRQVCGRVEAARSGPALAAAGPDGLHQHAADRMARRCRLRRAGTRTTAGSSARGGRPGC